MNSSNHNAVPANGPLTTELSDPAEDVRPQAALIPAVCPQQPSEAAGFAELDLGQECNLVERFQQDVERTGLVGEKKNAVLGLLVAVSAKLQRPLNLNMGGASAAGKNYLIGTVARFIPDDDKIILTGMSSKALMHSGEDEYRHKVVFIAEYEGVSGADYAIRTMQSEQVIEWRYAESSNQGIQTKSKRVKGPAAFIQATTRVTLHAENETRLLFTQMDESEEQTRAIMARQAQEAALGLSPPQGLFEPWHNLFRSLKLARVRISFAAWLAAHIPASRVRSRRDFPKLLGLIEASAFLHQHQRKKDSQGNIVATLEDYAIAKVLFEHCYYAGPESKVGELLQAAERLAQAQGEFQVTDLIRETSWRKSKTYQVLARAEELGCIGEGERGSWYRLLRKHSEPPLSLPSPEKLHCSTEGEGGSPDGKMENCPAPEGKAP